MAFQRGAGDATEFEGIQKAIEIFKQGTQDAQKDMLAYQRKAQDELNRRELRAKERLLDEIAEMQITGVIKSTEQAAAYAQAELEKQQQRKLLSEIEILRTISAENEKERQKEYERLDRERNILEKRAAVDNETDGKKKKQLQAELKAAEKENAIKNKKQKREDEQKKKADAHKEEGYEFGDKFYEAFDGLRDAISDENHAKKVAEENLLNTMKGVGHAIEDGLNAINQAISSYAKYQTGINARLQGSTAKGYSEVVGKLGAIAFSPLLRAEDLYSNLNELVQLGVARNVEQRAMFMTVKDGIATTFDVTNDSLRRMIRVQKSDSTAARLGMEAYLTKFLNTYVESTEYLTSTFDSVASSLFEASAMLGKVSGASATAEFEYVVQKWLGALTGVGMSESTAQEIANALGQLGSGAIEELSSSNMQNLLVMAANKANLSYAKMLNEGLSAVDTNELMLGMVKYLQEIEATGTNVVKNQLSKVFGVTVSDLIAVSNMEQDLLNNVHNDMLSYSNMYGELESQFKQLPGRLGISNILENLFSNLTYQTGMGIASNPATYALWKITDMIQGVTGGINVPFISAFGNGFDLNTTVENLMKIAVVGISTLGNIGGIISGLGSVGDGSVLLKKLSVSMDKADYKLFGGQLAGPGERKSGSTTSESSYVGNSDSDTYYDSTINAANDSAQAKVDAKAEEFKDPTVEYLDDEIDLKNQYKGFNEKLDRIVAALYGSSGASQSQVPASNTADNHSTSTSQVVGSSSSSNPNILAQQNIQNISTTAVNIFNEALLDKVITISDMLQILCDRGDKISSIDSTYGTASEALLDKVTAHEEATYTSTNSAITDIEKITKTYAEDSIVASGDNCDNIVEHIDNTATEYSKYIENNGTNISNNSEQLTSGKDYDISDYLVELDFAAGFKSLVDNVAKILEKIPNISNYDDFETEISGFTQFSL